ncbi:MAG: hypothetical protein U0414_12685 [Polyangiaceae bacterium]
MNPVVQTVVVAPGSHVSVVASVGASSRYFTPNAICRVDDADVSDSTLSPET